MTHQVAVITGASRGLGETLASFLAGQGYDLVVTARHAGPIEESAGKLRDLGVRAIAVPGDVTDPAHRRMVAESARSLGRLDLLVNNASDLGPMPPLSDLPLSALERTLQVNLLGPIGLIQETLPLLKASRGLIVNVTSDAAVGGYAGWGGYGSSKAALDLVSLTLAGELKETGVGVVSVDPGDMRTRMHQEAFPGEDITDRPLPEVTLPFWAWLLGQRGEAITGRRHQAQADRWETAS